MPHEEVMVGRLKIIPFPIQHDAIDPHGFLVSHDATTVGDLQIWAPHNLFSKAISGDVMALSSRPIMMKTC